MCVSVILYLLKKVNTTFVPVRKLTGPFEFQHLSSSQYFCTVTISSPQTSSRFSTFILYCKIQNGLKVSTGCKDIAVFYSFSSPNLINLEIKNVRKCYLS